MNILNDRFKIETLVKIQGIIQKQRVAQRDIFLL